nr:MAG: hypothetical protein CM15mV30_1600 [uncultured marine virus]
MSNTEVIGFTETASQSKIEQLQDTKTSDGIIMLLLTDVEFIKNLRNR